MIGTLLVLGVIIRLLVADPSTGDDRGMASATTIVAPVDPWRLRAWTVRYVAAAALRRLGR